MMLADFYTFYPLLIFRINSCVSEHLITFLSNHEGIAEVHMERSPVGLYKIKPLKIL